MLSGALPTSGAFVREHLRAPLTLVLLVAIPVFFVLIFASVLGDFAKALGGTLAAQSATAISAGWAAAFLSGTLAFFQVSLLARRRPPARRRRPRPVAGRQRADRRGARDRRRGQRRRVRHAVAGAAGSATRCTRSVAILSFAVDLHRPRRPDRRLRQGRARGVAAGPAAVLAGRLLEPGDDVERGVRVDADPRCGQVADRCRWRPWLTERRLAGDGGRRRRRTCGRAWRRSGPRHGRGPSRVGPHPHRDLDGLPRPAAPAAGPGPPGRHPRLRDHQEHRRDAGDSAADRPARRRRRSRPR